MEAPEGTGGTDEFIVTDVMRDQNHEIIEGVAIEIEENPFQERVDRLMSMMSEDDSIRDRLLCEVYINISEFVEKLNEIDDQMRKIGPAGMMRIIMKGGNL